MAFDLGNLQKGMDVATGIAGMAAGTVQRGMEMSDLPENTIQEQIDDLNRRDYTASSLEDVSSMFDTTQWAKTNWDVHDLLGMTKGQAAGKIAMNALQGGIQGAQFGTKLAPGWGTLIGAVIGTAADSLGSGFGWLSRKNKGYAAAGQGNYAGMLANNNAINKMNHSIMNIGQNTTNQSFLNLGALGGPLYTDENFTNGVRKISNGGTHEQNPNGGVPQGIAADGIPNLVEEGELIYNDYVFSKRLEVPNADKVLLGLQKKKDYTYADAADSIQQESEERPNDPISKRGLDAMMGRLQESQETLKQKKEDRRLRREFNKLSPLDKMNLMMALQQQEGVPQEGMPTQEPMMAAEGGALDGKGTWINGILNLVNSAVVQPVTTSMNQQIAADQAENPYIKPQYYAQQKRMYDDGGPFFDSDYMTGLPVDIQGQLKYGSSYGDSIDVDEEGNPILKITGEWSTTNPGGDNIVSKIDDQGREWYGTSAIPVQEYGDRLKWKPTYDKDGNQTGGYYQLVKKKLSPQSNSTNSAQSNPFAQTLRNMSVWGALAGAVGSLFDKPNYANLERAERAMAGVPRVVPGHIGQKMVYNPLDINYLAAQTANQGLGARRALVEYGGMPQAVIANNYANQLAAGQMFLNALKENNANRLQALEFNRSTDNANISNDLQAAMANQRRDLMGANYLLETAQLRDKERATVQNNRSVQWTNAYNQLHNLGADMLNREMAMAMAQSYGVPYNEQMQAAGRTIGPWYWPSGVVQRASKKGGKLNTKKGGKHA